MPHFDNSNMFFLFVIVAIGIIISIPVLHLLNRVRHTLALRRAQVVAINQRKVQSQQQVYVRQTDIESNMTREDRQKFNMAEELIAQGKIREAAGILEAIRFQRKAIDLLESHGLIDDACNVLLRLKVPMRAAVLYERNQMYDKAGHFYKLANKEDKAAECYMILSRTNFRFLYQAIEAYTKAGDFKNQLKAEVMAMQIDRVVQQCLEHNQFEILIDLLRDPVIARDVLSKMEEEDRKTLFEHIALVPINIQMLAGWIWIYPDYRVCALALEFVAQELELTKYFWMVTPPKLREFLLQLINKQARFLSNRLLTIHQQALQAAGFVAEAEAVGSVIQSKGPAPASLTETEPPKAIPFPLSS